MAKEWIYFGNVMNGKCFIGETLCIKRGSRYGEYWIINAKLGADGTLLEKVQAFYTIYDENGLYVNRKWEERVNRRLNFSRLDSENWLALWTVRF